MQLMATARYIYLNLRPETGFGLNIEKWKIGPQSPRFWIFSFVLVFFRSVIIVGHPPLL